jgi:hypothetical protein
MLNTNNLKTISEYPLKTKVDLTFKILVSCMKYVPEITAFYKNIEFPIKENLLPEYDQLMNGILGYSIYMLKSLGSDFDTQHYVNEVVKELYLYMRNKDSRILRFKSYLA